MSNLRGRGATQSSTLPTIEVESIDTAVRARTQGDVNENRLIVDQTCTGPLKPSTDIILSPSRHPHSIFRGSQHRRVRRHQQGGLNRGFRNNSLLMQTISEVLASKLPPGSSPQPMTQIDGRLSPFCPYGPPMLEYMPSGCFRHASVNRKPKQIEFSPLRGRSATATAIATTAVVPQLVHPNSLEAEVGSTGACAYN